MLKKATISDFPALYQLLEESFPADEYRSFADQEHLLSNPRYTLWITPEKDALLSIWKFEDFAFIEHFAVSVQLRNQGLGTKLLHWALSTLSCPAVLEAELPQNPIAQRRLSFYQRNGFFINDFAYLQPSYGKGRSAVPMKLLSSGAPLSSHQFKIIRDTLYQDVYHVKGRS